MRRKIILLVGIFFMYFSFVSADSSQTRTDFTLPGCNVAGEYTALYGCYRSPAIFNSYYCSGLNRPLNVFDIVGACFAKDGLINVDNDCCPGGYYCDSEEGKCKLSLYDCSHWITEEECEVPENTNCRWIDEVCVDITNLVCSSYRSEASCFNASEVSIENSVRRTNGICREGYVDRLGNVVVPGSTTCEWGDIDGNLGDECYLNCTITKSIYPHDVSPDTFSCPTLIYELSECVDGKQILEWAVYPGGKSYTIEELEEQHCINDGAEINCGKKVVSLSGFNFVNVVLVLLVLGAFYFLKGVYKKEGQDG